MNEKSEPGCRNIWACLDAFLGRDKRRGWLLALGLLGIIAWVNYAVAMEYSFGLFYIIPVAFVAWQEERRAVIFMCLASWLVWGFVDCWHCLAAGKSLTGDILLWWDLARGAVIFFVMVVLITHLKRALAHERDLLRLKTEMLSLVSHEFNNSLTSMGMALFLLRENDKDPEFRHDVYPVLERIHVVLKQTVHNFLNQARMQSGRFILDIRQCELRGLVEEIASLLRPLAEQKKIEMRVQFPEKVFPISADREALALVLTNIITNAIKYTPQRGCVAVSLIPRGEPPSEVEVSVQDNGIGIALEDQKSIFEGYRTANGRKEARGYGVGLKVANDLVASHDSALKLESTPGKGSRFYFTFPICPPTCPNYTSGLCHRCQHRNPIVRHERYDFAIVDEAAKGSKKQL